MVWFYTRGLARRSCETRLATDGEGFELVVRDAGKVRVERFADLPKLMARAHQLLTAWKAQGPSRSSGVRTRTLIPANAGLPRLPSAHPGFAVGSSYKQSSG